MKHRMPWEIIAAVLLGGALAVAFTYAVKF
jgi:hypothetical protein